jgi:hypothetical protein
VYLCDVNEDGFADIVVRDQSFNPYVFLNNGRDHFYLTGQLTTERYTSEGLMRQRALVAEFSYLNPNNKDGVWTVKAAEVKKEEGR